MSKESDKQFVGTVARFRAGNGSPPMAWINENGCVMNNDKFEETKASKDWGWIIEKHWSNAVPLYTKEQL
jgi:hypothetical protein